MVESSKQLLPLFKCSNGFNSPIGEFYFTSFQCEIHTLAMLNSQEKATYFIAGRKRAGTSKQVHKILQLMIYVGLKLGTTCCILDQVASF